ncbi:right-handed parallel beta-helix repeat-containing protein [Pendulispora brunnea]|uniref:Right-handed parallel beta-helix repeat-containing protein n=1 Tax=Pendulispora brunnea TaxID=2905690 RepID=A0ABZ2KMY6_9BACT
MAKLAAAGDTVLLKAGTYDIANGETFPRTPYDWNVPDDVTIQGEGWDATLLRGPDDANCETNSALVLQGSARIRALGVVAFCNGIRSSTKGVVEIQAVKIRGTQTAVELSTNATLDLMDISSSKTAINSSHGPLTIINSRVHENRSGIHVDDSMPLVVTASEIDHNCRGESPDESQAILLKNEATLTDVRVHDNECPGIRVSAGGLTGPIVIAKSYFDENKPAAITVDAAVRTTIRESHFFEHKQAIRLNGESNLDLGTPEEPGNNSFTVCDTCDAIFDARPAPAQGSNPITVKGISWTRGGDALPVPMGCFDTDYPKGSTSPPRLWHIEHPGRCATATGNIILN